RARLEAYVDFGIEVLRVGRVDDHCACAPFKVGRRISPAPTAISGLEETGDVACGATISSRDEDCVRALRVDGDPIDPHFRIRRTNLVPTLSAVDALEKVSLTGVHRVGGLRVDDK